MKRVISTFLALVMILSVCSSLTFSVSAAESSSKYTVKTNGFKNGEITFDVYVAPTSSLTDATVTAKYNTSVLEIVSAGPATTIDSDGNETEVISGVYEHGTPIYDSSCYTFAYMNTDGFKVTTSKKIFTVTFKLRNTSKPTATSIEFVAGSYDSTDAIVSYQNIATFDAPVITAKEMGADSITIKWNAVAGVEGYRVFRKSSAGFEKIAEVNSSTLSFTDINRVDGTTYTYSVVSMDPLGFSGIIVPFDIKFEHTHTLSDWYVDGAYKCRKCTVCGEVVEKQAISLSVPNVSIKNDAKGIKVTWNTIAGAESYIVYRSTYNASKKTWSSWSVIKDDYTSTSYTDSKVVLGTTYKYTVRAVAGSTRSNYKGTSSLKYNVTPTVKVSNETNGIKVTWTTAANADGYRVYRSTYNSKTKKWSSWKNMGTTKATTKSWTDKSVSNNTYYKYTVRAVEGKFLSSYKASSQTRFFKVPTVKIANASTGVKVSWSKISGATGYTVYSSEYVNGKWTSWKNRGTTKSTTTSWTDKKVKSGVKYKYTVRAVNGSYKSAYVASSTLLYLAQPKVTVANASNGIKVSWTQSEGATGYTVYSSTYNTKTKKWSSWSNRGTAKATSKSWTDKKAKKGTTYRYTVRAVNGSAKSTYKASSSIKR